MAAPVGGKSRKLIAMSVALDSVAANERQRSRRKCEIVDGETWPASAAGRRGNLLDRFSDVGKAALVGFYGNPGVSIRIDCASIALCSSGPKAT